MIITDDHDVDSSSRRPGLSRARQCTQDGLEIVTVTRAGPSSLSQSPSRRRASIPGRRGGRGGDTPAVTVLFTVVTGSLRE